MIQFSHPYMTTGKTIALTRWTFVGKVMPLLFNMLSRLVIAFLPRSKRLLISWLQSPSAMILELPQNKVCHCFHCFPIYLPWNDGIRCHDTVFWKFFTLLFHLNSCTLFFPFSLGILCWAYLSLFELMVHFKSFLNFINFIIFWQVLLIRDLPF